MNKQNGNYFNWFAFSRKINICRIVVTSCCGCHHLWPPAQRIKEKRIYSKPETEQSRDETIELFTRICEYFDKLEREVNLELLNINDFNIKVIIRIYIITAKFVYS